MSPAGPLISLPAMTNITQTNHITGTARVRASAYLLIAIFLAGCSSGGSTTADSGEPELLATVGDHSITTTDVRERIGERLDLLDVQYRRSRHQLIEETVEELLRDRLLSDEAAAKGITVDELVRAEIDATINNAEAPALGPADAPVTLVEFSDFECPFCARFYSTLKQLEENYGDQLRIVYRQFPLENIHAHAFDAAEASLCAHEQGRFWEMHDLLFDEQDQLGVDALKAKAERLGLDRPAFDTCLGSNQYAEQIQRDLRDGASVGIQGTPALFVNGVRVPGGAVPYETVAAAIDKALQRNGSSAEPSLGLDRNNKVVNELVMRLWEERGAVYYLEPFRVELDNDGSPVKGPADAPVALVEFSDFECPFCARFYRTLKQLEENYGDRLRIVYRQSPIKSIHLYAFDAAEASLCAHDQGRFWEMHDLLFEEQDQLDMESLKEKAGRLGLDQQGFDDCLESGKYTDQIQRDLSEGQSVGVTGTPALFVNGIFVPGGAVPYETIAAAIDRELQRESN